LVQDRSIRLPSRWAAAVMFVSRTVIPPPG
jgi:hypothetical protein